jgi:hypothetical protein
MIDRLSRLWRIALRWPYTKQGTIVLGVVVLLMGVVGVYGFMRWGDVIDLVCGIVIIALVTREWVKLYRHRDDPNWPPKPKFVTRHEPQSKASHAGR